MSDDRRINVRGSFYQLLEEAAERRHMPVASFVTFVLGEYLRTCGELVTSTPVSAPNNVSPPREHKGMPEHVGPITVPVPAGSRLSGSPVSKGDPDMLAAVIAGWGDPDEADD